MYGLQNFESFHKDSEEPFRKQADLLKTSFWMKQLSSLCDTFDVRM